jgi:ribosomal-protein-alanine N-acetyltransferase
VFLEVRVSNRLAYALYVSEGFCEIGNRRNYYPAREGREDAIVLARSL